MINALFGFRGRLGRLAFLGWNLVGMILVGAITIAFLVLAPSLRRSAYHLAARPFLAS